MAFSYGKQPNKSAIDYIRFKLGDTTDEGHYLDDDEITAVLEDFNGDKKKATVVCCEAIVANLAGKVSYSIGPEKVNLTDAYNNYRTLLRSLKRGTNSAPPFYKATPQFKIGMHDNV